MLPYQLHTDSCDTSLGTKVAEAKRETIAQRRLLHRKAATLMRQSFR